VYVCGPVYCPVALNSLAGLCRAVAGQLIVLYFRVKFYVPDPAMLREEFTRSVYFHVFR